ncbi:MAG: hypothetical protein ABSA16_18325, partial [Thermoguttaceae bacterium]
MAGEFFPPSPFTTATGITRAAIATYKPAAGINTIVTTGFSTAGDLGAGGAYTNQGVNSATVTITDASPAVVSWASHGLPAGAPVIFGGILPTGLVAGTTYYVSGYGLASGAFSVSTTYTVALAALVGGCVNTSSAGTAPFTCCSGPMALQDSNGTWWQLVVNGPVNAGACGVLVDGADVTNNLQLWLNLCETATQTNYSGEGAIQGNFALLPAGEYQISATIVIPDGVILSGQGSLNTRIWAASTWNSTTYPWMIQLGPRWNDASPTAFATILERIAISNPHTVSGLTCVYSESVQEQCAVIDCGLAYPTKYGIWYNGSLGGNVPAHNAIERIDIWGSTGCIAGIYLQSSHQISIKTISAVTVNTPANPFYGVWIDSNSEAHVEDIHAEVSGTGIAYGVYNAGMATITEVICQDMPTGSCAVMAAYYAGMTALIECYNADAGASFTFIDQNRNISIPSQTRVVAYFASGYNRADCDVTFGGIPGFLGDTYVTSPITYTSNTMLAAITGLGTIYLPTG